MKRIIICLLFSTMLLMACSSKEDNNLNNKQDNKAVENTTETDGKSNNTNNLKEESNKEIIEKVKNFILNGQGDIPEALKLKWSKSFLNNLDLERLYKDFLDANGKKDNVEEFAKYITENAPISSNWEEMFKKDFYETYKEEVVKISHLDGDLYEASIIINGIETPYVVVSSRTGYYHGTSGNTTTNSRITKKQFLEQLDKLEVDLESTKDTRYASPVTDDLIEAASKEYKLWDDKLNEIYNYLQTILSEDEMNKLTKEEIQWINVRDEKSEAAAKKNEGGTIAPFNRIMSLISSTRDRCYELVNTYIK